MIVYNVPLFELESDGITYLILFQHYILSLVFFLQRAHVLRNHQRFLFISGFRIKSAQSEKCETSQRNGLRKDVRKYAYAGHLFTPL